MSFTCATSDLFDHYIIKALALKSCDEFIFLKQFIFIQNVVIVKHISCSSTLKKEKVAQNLAEFHVSQSGTHKPVS